MESMPTFPKKDFTKYFIGANPKAVEVLDRLLVMDPDRRASATELLTHPWPYFANYSVPEDEMGGAYSKYIMTSLITWLWGTWCIIVLHPAAPSNLVVQLGIKIAGK